MGVSLCAGMDFGDVQKAVFETIKDHILIGHNVEDDLKVRFDWC
jgi:hypothetical protein